MRIGIDLLSERGTPGGIHTYTNELLRHLSRIGQEQAELSLELCVFAHGDFQFLFPIDEAPAITVVRLKCGGLPAAPRRLS